MKRHSKISKIMLAISVLVLVSVCAVNSTYAWLQITTQRGIYPYYEVEFITPSSDFYAVLEIATGETYNEATDEYEIIYENINNPLSDVRHKLMYPGDSINLRFRLANLSSDTSLSIYFTNILDSLLKDDETGLFLENFLSEYIIIGSNNFEIRTSGDDGEDGFLYYASDKLEFGETDITPYTNGVGFCDEASDGCYLHNRGVLFAGNISVPHSVLQNGYTQAQYDAELAQIEATTNSYYDKMDLLYKAYTSVELQWFIMFDREATLDATNAIFQIGTVFLSVD